MGLNAPIVCSIFSEHSLELRSNSKRAYFDGSNPIMKIRNNRKIHKTRI